MSLPIGTLAHFVLLGSLGFNSICFDTLLVLVQFFNNSLVYAFALPMLTHICTLIF